VSKKLKSRLSAGEQKKQMQVLNLEPRNKAEEQNFGGKL
jgi:hypothetical protein